MAKPVYIGSSLAEWTTVGRPTTYPALGLNTDSDQYEYLDKAGNWQELIPQSLVTAAIQAAISGTTSAPGIVTNLATGTITSGTVVLTWEAPATGSAPTAWSVLQTPNGGTPFPAEGTFGATGGTVMGLASGTAYVFEVFASNPLGTSPAATIGATTVTTVTAPGNVTSPAHGTITPTTVVLTWGAPATGSPPTSWAVTSSPTGVTGTFGATGGLATGLTPSTSYTFSVVASNSGGDSSAATITATTADLIVAPGPVTALALGTITTNTVTLTWSAPAIGTPPITWAVMQSVGGGAFTPSAGQFGATGGTVTGLLPSTTYALSVTDSNAAGTSSAVTINATTSAVIAQQTVTGIGLSPGVVTVGDPINEIVGTLSATTSDGLPLPSPSWSISSGGTGYAIVNGNQIELTASPTTAGTALITITVTSSSDPTFTGTVSVVINPQAGTGLLQPLTAVAYVPFANTISIDGGQGQFYGQAIPTGGIGNILWTMNAGSAPPGQLTINSSSGAVAATFLANGNYPVTITGTDGLGNTASTSLTLTASASGIFTVQTNGANGNPLNFYLDNSNYNSASSQVNYVVARDPSFTGTTTMTMTDPSGKMFFTGPLGGDGGLHQFGFFPWPPPAGNYPISFRATNTASGTVLTKSYTIFVGKEGGPTKQILFVQNGVIGSPAPAGTVVGTCYGHAPFNNPTWSILTVGSPFSIGSNTGILTVVAPLTAGTLPLSVQIADGTAGLSYSQAINVNVAQGNVISPNNMAVNVTPNLVNTMMTGTLASATVTGLSGTPAWSLSGDGTAFRPNVFGGPPRYTINASGTTGTVTINNSLPASIVLNGVDYSDQVTITATDGLNFCSKTIKLQVNWPSNAGTFHIGPGQTYATFNAFCHAAGMPNLPLAPPFAGATLIVHPDSNNYVGGLWDNQAAGFTGPIRMIAAPGSGQRVKIDCSHAPNQFGVPNSKFAFGTGGGNGYTGKAFDLWMQGFELFNCLTGGNGGSGDNQDAIAGDTYGTGFLWCHDMWVHDNCMGIGRLSAGQKAFMTNVCSERGGQGLPNDTHNYYMQWVDMSFCDNCLFMGVSGGHQYKSRGWVNELRNCRFFDGEQSAGSFQINLTEGGLLTIDNCVVQKSPNQDNPESIAFIEGLAYPGDWYFDVAPNHVVNITNSTFICERRPSDIIAGGNMTLFFTAGVLGAVSGKPPSVTMDHNSVYGYVPSNYMVLGNGSTGTITNTTVLSEPPALDFSLPTTVLNTTAAQPAANQLQFATPVKAYVNDPVDILNATGRFTAPGTWITAINPATGVVTLNVNSLSSVPVGTSIQLGYGMAGCSLNDPYKATLFTLGNAGDANPDHSGNCPMAFLLNPGTSSVVGGCQVIFRRRDHDLRIPVNSSVGTVLVTPLSWFGGSSGVSTPNYALGEVPGGRWSINASTGAIFVAAPLVVGTDTFCLHETNSGYFCYLYVTVTSGGTGGITAPGPVTSLAHGTISSNSVVLTWGAPATGSAPTAWSVTSVPAGAAGSFGAGGGTVTGLSPSTAYVLSVTDANSAGTSSAVTISITTGAASGAGATPLLHAAGVVMQNPSNQAVILVGSHTWTNLQDIVGGGRGGDGTPAITAWPNANYLSFMQANGMNVIRGWNWESYNDGGSGHGRCTPTQYVMTGTDGVFDLSQLNQAFFDRIRARALDAAAAGVYLIIQIFNTSSTDPGFGPAAWNAHPFKSSNNINSINGDPSSAGNGLFIHTVNATTGAAIWTLQKTYMNKLIATVADLSNVLFEVANEGPDDSATRTWYLAVVDYMHAQEIAGGGLHHPVGLTPQHPAVSQDDVNNWLLASNADWVSLARGNWTTFNQPLAPGTKMVFLDTDHIFGMGGDWTWIWTAFMRGFSILYMDDFEGTTPALENGTFALNFGITGQLQSARVAMGQVSKLATLVNFTTMTPSATAVPSVGGGFAWVDATNGQYVVLTTAGNSTFTVDLSGSPSRTMNVRWMDLSNGVLNAAGTVIGGSGTQSFTNPLSQPAVLILTP